MILTRYFVTFSLLLSFTSGLIMPMKKPSGEADIDSVINHVTLMEQTINILQNQVQTSTIELRTVKGKLQTAEDDITAVKAELKLAETDIAILKHDLEKSPDPVEFALLKNDFEALKVNQNALLQQINFTVIDAVSADVKINTRYIQSLKSKLITTESEVTKTSSDILITRTDIAKMNSGVSLLNTKLNQSIQDAASNKENIANLTFQLNDVSKSANSTSNSILSLETRLTSVENEYDTFQSRQNITEYEVTECKTLGQSTAADLKTFHAEVNTISTAVTDLHGEVSVITNKTNKDVAFQVTQTRDASGWTTLQFDKVLYNAGDGYNKTTGMFKAPVAGTYIFWANVLFLNGNKGIHRIDITKETNLLARGWVTVHDEYISVSTASITHLEDGNLVHFSTDSTSNVIGDSGFSNYGGALLHAS